MTDIKQAVRELREALGWYKDGLNYKAFSRIVEPLIPAVLDRLEELERENTMIKLAEEPVYSRRKLIAERDAIRAKFAEFRAAIEEQSNEWSSVGNWAGADLNVLLTRFPALDSSETTDGREG